MSVPVSGGGVGHRGFDVVSDSMGWDQERSQQSHRCIELRLAGREWAGRGIRGRGVVIQCGGDAPGRWRSGGKGGPYAYGTWDCGGAGRGGGHREVSGGGDSVRRRENFFRGSRSGCGMVTVETEVASETSATVAGGDHRMRDAEGRGGLSNTGRRSVRLQRPGVWAEGVRGRGRVGEL